ncbi:MAG: metallophosphoesterase [Planctomycetota bacterium]|nr:metallophosphoesterase [Planctomycetota bacterium]
MFKFLHAADLHLDSPLRGLERYVGCPADEVRTSSRRALVNLVEMAIVEQVAFVVIAGDIYDGDLPDYGACLFLNDQMLRLKEAKIPVYLIQGNHDAESHMTRHLKLPENVHRFPTDRPGSEVVAGCDAVIHGQGFASRAVTENLAGAYPAARPGLFNVGLLHTCVEGREGHDRYAPCSLDDLRSKTYDYWALGHIHTFEILATDPHIVFAGNLQGRHARETGAKGAVLVTVDGGRVKTLDHRPLDVMRWAVRRVDATGAKTEDDLLERAGERLLALAGEDGRLPTAVRLEIHGPCAAHDRLAGRYESLVAGIRALAQDVGGGRLWIEKVAVRTSPERARDEPDGSIRVLLDYLDAIRADETKLAALGGELADLKKKLPAGWADGGDRLDLDDPVRILATLEQIGSDLVNALTTDGGVAS